MKNLTIILMITFLFPVVMLAQSKAPEEKPRLVVFVVGMENEQVGDYLTNLVGNNLSKNYTIIPRSEAVKKKMQELKEYEDAGHIDDRQLIEWGRQHNVQVLCLVTAAHVEEYMFSAQLTDVKTNTLLGNAEYEIPSLGSEDLKKAAAAIAGQLLNQLRRNNK